MKFRHLINRLLSYRKPVFNLQAGHHKEIAFVHQGVEYWHFTDAFNIPCERAKCAVDAYNTLNTRIDREFLNAITQSGKTERSKKSIDIGVWFKNDLLIEERLNFIVPPRRFILKLASIVFFDASEDPYFYDEKYGDKKIAIWEKNKDLMDFFLSLPIKNLIFSEQHTKEDLVNFMKVVELIDQQHLLNLSTHLSSGKPNPGLSKVLQSLQKQLGHITSSLTGSTS